MSEGLIPGSDGVDSSTNYAQPVASPQVFEHPCLPLTKILSSGSFYYALDSPWDLSSRLAVRLSKDPKSARDLGTFDERFVWNEYIVRSLLDFREHLDVNEREDLDNCQFIVCWFFRIGVNYLTYIYDRFWQYKDTWVYSPWRYQPHRQMGLQHWLHSHLFLDSAGNERGHDLILAVLTMMEIPPILWRLAHFFLP